MIICRNKIRQQLPVEFKLILKGDLGQIRGQSSPPPSHTSCGHESLRMATSEIGGRRFRAAKSWGSRFGA